MQLYTIRQSGVTDILRWRCRVDFLDDVRSNSSSAIHLLAQSACAETRLEFLNPSNQIN
jgi:hypothetical protein